MASSSSSPFFLTYRQLRSRTSYKTLKERHLFLSVLSIRIPARFPLPFRASRRYPNYNKKAAVFVPDPRGWVGDFGAEEVGGRLNGDEDDDGDEDEDDDDRSFDLLVRLLQNLFRNISRQARLAVRSVLPPSISTKLVRFTVNGVLILACLWLLKAFLEVMCRVGSMVFFSILLVRGVWSSSSTTHIKESQCNNYLDRISNINCGNNSSWNGGGAQPVG